MNMDMKKMFADGMTNLSVNLNAYYSCEFDMEKAINAIKFEEQ
jgi:hypothetical protein